MTTLPLDTRQASIARALLKRTGTASVDTIASSLHLTDRMVRYDLPAIEAWLTARGLRLVRQRGVGVRVDGDRTMRAAVAEELDTAPGPVVLEPEDRQSAVLLALLQAAPEAVRSGALEARLGVSGPTIRRDVRVAETWLEQHRLHLRRLPGVGIGVRGSEVDVRAAILALLLERVPVEVLSGEHVAAARATSVPTGLAGFIAGLDLPTYRRVLARELPDVDDRDPTLVTATVGLAILIDRLRVDRPARLVRGRLRSLLDHPVTDDARRIAAAVSAETGIAIGSTEIAAITESLLGFVELGDPTAPPQATILAAVDRLVTAAAARLDPSLAGDELLRANLTEHLRRLAVRLRYGLPVSNPLQHEVRKRYPDVYEAARTILHELRSLDGSAIPVDEVGFLTMYLAGSLERLRLRPKVRITVVCPAGMATVWILVSRLLSEFPQVEVSQVVSKTAYERAPGNVTSDFIVSTVQLDVTPDVPTLVVSPLLQEGDVRRLARMLGLPAQH